MFANASPKNSLLGDAQPTTKSGYGKKTIAAVIALFVGLTATVALWGN